MRRLGLAALLALGLCPDAWAANHVFTITLPTTRVDGTALPLAQIGNAQVYDTSVPVPGAPGTLVTCSPALVFPPTTATLSCTANVSAGHSFEATVSDNSTPVDTSAVSNQVSLPQVAPSPPTLAVQ